MKFSRSFAVAFAAVTAFVAASCSDVAPTAPATPTAAPQADLLGSLGKITQGLLLSCKPMVPYHASAVIGSDGGTLQIGPHTFNVPRGALTRDVLITADAPSDHLNRVVFQPEGLQFKKSASLTMSYANCDGLGSLLPKHIAYTTDQLQILSLLNSVDNLLTNKVTGQVDHFSEYVISW